MNFYLQQYISIFTIFIHLYIILYISQSSNLFIYLYISLTTYLYIICS